MRCIAGFALFVILYFSSCTILAGAARHYGGHANEVEVVRKYHALVAVGCGAVSLFLCYLPTLMAKKNNDDVWQG